MTEKIEKTRDISIYDFLVSLQKEFVVCELRKKIYPKIKDKKYYEKVMGFKKDKIEDIADRNKLPSIFSKDEEVAKMEKDNFYNQIYGESGYPNFMYKDQSNEDEFGRLDKIYYYSSGSEVKVNIDGVVKVGNISSLSDDGEIVMIKIKGEAESTPFGLDAVTRIL